MHCSDYTKYECNFVVIKIGRHFLLFPCQRLLRSLLFYMWFWQFHLWPPSSCSSYYDTATQKITQVCIFWLLLISWLFESYHLRYLSSIKYIPLPYLYIMVNPCFIYPLALPLSEWRSTETEMISFCSRYFQTNDCMASST